MKRNRRGNSESSRSEFSARSSLTWSDDGQRLTIKTPQLKAAGIGFALLAGGCLVLSFRERPATGFTTESTAGGQNVSAILALSGLVIAALAVYFLYTNPGIETVLDRASQKASVTRRYFGRAFQQPVTIPLSAILDTRLAGTSRRFESMAKVVTDIDDVESDLTGASGTDFADDAQKAIRRFVGLN